MNGISKIVCSLDTHIPQQIFHPCWWVNSNKEQPIPYTIITYEDFKQEKWEPVFGDKEETETYLRKLEKEGKKQLCIWPYHCIWGTEGAMIENEFSKMVYFHSVVRNSICKIIEKGKDQYSEMYGIVKPEYSKDNFMNKEILELVEEYDEIYVVGEAASHCLMESVKQIAEHFKNFKETTKKITILEDCTSPIKGYENDTKATFDYFKNTYGIKVLKSTDIKF